MSTYEVIVTGFWIVASIWAIGVLTKGSSEEDRLRTDGLAATLVVSSVSETGRWAANNPVLTIEGYLTQEQDKPPYPVRITEMIPVSQVPAVQPGKHLKVLVARDDPQKVLINEQWNQ